LSQGQTISVRELGLERRTTGVMSAVAASDSMIGMPAFGSSTQLPAAPSSTDGGITLPDGLSLEEAERRYAVAVLERCEGNQSAAARALGISRNKLARLLKTQT